MVAINDTYSSVQSVSSTLLNARERDSDVHVTDAAAFFTAHLAKHA
jgi:hypothetical protein